MSLLKSSESAPSHSGLQPVLPAELQAPSSPAGAGLGPAVDEWQPVAALRSPPQEAMASTFVDVVRNWVGSIHPPKRRGQ